MLHLRILAMNRHEFRQTTNSERDRRGSGDVAVQRYPENIGPHHAVDDSSNDE